MNNILRNSSLAIALACAGLVAGCAHGPMSHMGMMHGESEHVSLTGANEVPPVDTSATGSGRVTIHEDHTVTAKIKVKGMHATAAHIHEGAPGVNGPVIVPFTKSEDDEFTAPPGAKLTDEQYQAYKAGNLYVNVHSAAHKGGEIRAQLVAQ